MQLRQPTTSCKTACSCWPNKCVCVGLVCDCTRTISTKKSSVGPSALKILCFAFLNWLSSLVNLCHQTTQKHSSLPCSVASPHPTWVSLVFCCGLCACPHGKSMDDRVTTSSADHTRITLKKLAMAFRLLMNHFHCTAHALELSNMKCSN
jgi:hypothetical protein